MNQNEVVSVLPFQLGHVLEVHAIHAGDEGERHEDRGDDGQDLHDSVQLVADAGKVNADHLGQDLAEDLDRCRWPAQRGRRHPADRAP